MENRLPLIGFLSTYLETTVQGDEEEHIKNDSWEGYENSSSGWKILVNDANEPAKMSRYNREP